MTIPTGFVKSMSHASRRGAPGGLLGDVEHDRHRPQRFREATRPRRLLADGPEPRWQRLVHEARRLAADP